MQLKNYYQAANAAMLLTFLNFQSGLAASITYDTSGNSNVNFNKIAYTHGDRVGESWVVQPTLLQRGGTPGLRRLLQNYFPDWTFLIAPPASGNSSLKGEFKIKQYYACGNLTDCGNPSTIPINYGVGALLDLDFIPRLSDPQSNNQFKWIGRVTSNHSQLPSPNGSYGLKEDRIDNNARTDNPFAVLTGNNSSSPTNFYDRPYRGNPQDNHAWNSELFLAREIGTKTAVIYDGIAWGWKNRTLPNPACFGSGSQCPPPPPACTGDSGGGGCAINAANFFIDEELFSDNNNSSTSIPESTSVLGLLALGAWGIVKALKICFNK
jgi:hypothetical protein